MAASLHSPCAPYPPARGLLLVSLVLFRSCFLSFCYIFLSVCLLLFSFFFAFVFIFSGVLTMDTFLVLVGLQVIRDGTRQRVRTVPLSTGTAVHVLFVRVSSI